MSIAVAFIVVLALIAGSMWLIDRNAPRRPRSVDASNAAALGDVESQGWDGDTGGGGDGAGDGDGD
jgi:hypothetical protein